MRKLLTIMALSAPIMLTSCIKKGPNPQDPYESINREIHKFNNAFDATMLKPVAKTYVAVVPGPIRKAVHSAYNNVDLIPSVANDLLQGEFKWAIKDSWRFFINTTIGLGGIWDPAAKCGLPEHYNDLGITLAKWGDKNSPYIVVPFLGPSTIRDGMGMMFQFSLMTPYPYINDNALMYSLIGFRYLDLRAQLLDNEALFGQALDQYSFIRDAYLQYRNFKITGVEKKEEELGSQYIDEDEVGDIIDDAPLASNELKLKNKASA